MAPAEKNFPVAGLARDGWSTEDEATATCFCGAVQLVFPIQGPGLINRHVCHCSDCRKISSSFYMSNITVADAHLRHVRGGQEDESGSGSGGGGGGGGALKTFAQRDTVRSGGLMTNYFCGTCGTLMYRRAERYPGLAILRTGTVDDFALAETKLRPQVEQFVETRVAWQRPIEGVPQVEGMHKREDLGKL